MHSSNVLISFDMIFDLDIALLSLIREKYLDEEEFKFDMITQPKSVLKYILKNSSSENPLYEFVNNKEDAEGYYIKFLEEKYDEILEYTEPTAIFELVTMFISTRGMILPTILYTDEREEKLISKFNKYGRVGKVLADDWKIDIDLNMYDAIYVKDYRDVLMFNLEQFTGKNVYISSNLYNMTLDMNNRLIPNIDITVLCMDYNEINIIDLYKDSEYSEYCEIDEDYNEDNEEDYDEEDFM